MPHWRFFVVFRAPEEKPNSPMVKPNSVLFVNIAEVEKRREAEKSTFTHSFMYLRPMLSFESLPTAESS